MPDKTIHLIRHAQSEHNARALTAPDEDVLRHDPALRDAPLTPLGEAQARALAAEVEPLQAIELIVTSPLTRAIQTMLIAFAAHPAPRLVEALHREHLDSWCDVGRSPRALAAAFPSLRFDHLNDPWWHVAPGHADGFMREDVETLDQRIAAFRVWLAARPERHIAVIGHSGFLRRLTGTPFANGQRIVVTLDTEATIRLRPAAAP